MKKLLNATGMMFTLFLATCSHQELRSPCNNVKLAAAPGLYVPCGAAQPINRIALVEEKESQNS